MIRLLAALGLAVGSLVLVAAPAHACSCVGGTPATYADRAGLVFTGEVVSTTDPDGEERILSSARLVILEVEVDRVFKGDVGPRARIGTAADGASCGLGQLPRGKPMVFFADAEPPLQRDAEKGPGLLHSTTCHGTGPAQPDVVVALVAALGEPSPPGEAPDAAEPDDAAAGSPYDSTPETTVDEPDEDGGGALLWPWLVGLFAVATGAAAYVARRTT